MHDERVQLPGYVRADGTNAVRNDVSIWPALTIQTAEMPLEVRIGSWVRIGSFNVYGFFCLILK